MSAAGFIERAIGFGPDRGLVGILTTPAEQTQTSTWALLVNAGVIHRVGPNRINVGFARDLAGAGLPSLRFDQSGLGDSEPREGVTDLHESSHADMLDAMAYLKEHHGAERFVLVGICSGARLVLRTSYRAPDIAAAVVIDPPVYKTTKAVVAHFAPRLLRADAWKNALTGRNKRVKGALDRLRSRKQANEAPEAPPPSSMPERLDEWPPRADMAEALARMVRNGTRLLWIHTGGAADEQYNYKDQVRDVFPHACASGLIDWDLMADVDHDFATEPSRRAIRTVVCDWVKRRGFAG